MKESWYKDYPLIELTESNLDDNTSYSKMLRLIGDNKHVIDFGCATGYFAKLLNEKGCRVTGVEINPQAAKLAEPFCEQVIVADLDFTPLKKIFPDQTFDVAVFGDVLEHLRNPWEVLEELQQILTPNGFVVASIPNIAHGAIRLALLQGNFEYMKLGILDNTHLRFFTRTTVEELFERTGYFVDAIDRTTVPIFSGSNLIPAVTATDFDQEIVQKIQQEEDAETLQFVLRAYPLSLEGKFAALNNRYTTLFDRYQNLQHELKGYQSQWQEQQTNLDAEVQRLTQENSALHDWNRQLEAGRDWFAEQLKSTQAELEKLAQHYEESCNWNQQLEAEKDQFTAQLKFTQAELEKLSQQQNEKDALLAQIQTIQLELEAFKKQNVELQEQKQVAISKLEQVETELKQQNRQLGSTQKQLQATTVELDQLKTSRLWKVQRRWQKLKQVLGFKRNS